MPPYLAAFGRLSFAILIACPSIGRSVTATQAAFRALSPMCRTAAEDEGTIYKVTPSCFFDYCATR